MPGRRGRESMRAPCVKRGAYISLVADAYTLCERGRRSLLRATRTAASVASSRRLASLGSQRTAGFCRGSWKQMCRAPVTYLHAAWVSAGAFTSIACQRPPRMGARRPTIGWWTAPVVELVVCPHRVAQRHCCLDGVRGYRCRTAPGERPYSRASDASAPLHIRESDCERSCERRLFWALFLGNRGQLLG